MHIREMLRQFGIGNPYEEFDASGIQQDLQGWASEHPYFGTFVNQTEAEQIIEVGAWKGASAINMARHALSARSTATVLCIDTWLGSNAVLWKDETLRSLLKLEHGYPSLYKQFLANIVHSGLTDTMRSMETSFIEGSRSEALPHEGAQLVPPVGLVAIPSRAAALAGPTFRRRGEGRPPSYLPGSPWALAATHTA